MREVETIIEPPDVDGDGGVHVHVNVFENGECLSSAATDVEDDPDAIARALIQVALARHWEVI